MGQRSMKALEKVVVKRYFIMPQLETNRKKTLEAQDFPRTRECDQSEGRESYKGSWFIRS